MFLANSLASQHELTPELWFLSSSTPQRLYLPTLHRQQSCPRRWGFRPWALAATGVGAQTSSGGFPVAMPSLMHFGSPMPWPLAQLTGEEHAQDQGACSLPGRQWEPIAWAGVGVNDWKQAVLALFTAVEAHTLKVCQPEVERSANLYFSPQFHQIKCEVFC